MKKYAEDVKRKRTTEDLMKALQTRVSFLLRECLDYDKGDLDQALKIAISLRVLLCDSRGGKPLLAQLSLMKGDWYNFALDNDVIQNQTPNNTLVDLVVSDNSGIIAEPKLTKSPSSKLYKNFNEWWKVPVTNNDKHRPYSRCDLVSGVAGMESAHVDEALPESFWALIEGTYLNVKGFIGGQLNHFINLHYASLRTIAHETLLTVQRRCPEAFKKCSVYPEEIIRKRTSSEISLKGIHLSKATPLNEFTVEQWRRRANNVRNQNERKKIYEDCLVKFPRDVDLRVDYAIFLIKELKNSEEARVHLKKAVTINPKSINAIMNYANYLWVEAKEYDLAEKYYEKAEEIFPNNELILLKKAYFQHKGQKDRKAADNIFKKMLRLFPNRFDVMAHYILFLSGKNKNILADGVHSKKILKTALEKVYPEY